MNYLFFFFRFLKWCLLFLDGFVVFRSEGTTLLKYKIPTRGLLGLRNAILTASRGTAILNTIFDSYGPWAGDMSTRDLGSLVTIHSNDIEAFFFFCVEMTFLPIMFIGCF